MSEKRSASGSNGHDHDALREVPLQLEWVKIEWIFGNLSSPRINEAGVDPVAASLRRFGWRQPGVAKPLGEVNAGPTRLKPARRLGMTKVPAVRFEGTDSEVTANSIGDNRTHEFSKWAEPRSRSSYRN